MVPAQALMPMIVGLSLGITVLFIPLSKLGILAAAAMLGIVIIRAPFTGLVLFGSLAAFAPYTTIELGVRITISEAVLAFTWLGAALRLLTGETPSGFGPTERAVITLMIYSALPFAVGQLMVDAEGSGIANWLRWLLNVSAVLLVAILVRSTKEMYVLLGSVIVGATAMLGMSLYVFAIHRDANAMIPVLEAMRYSHPESVRDIFSGNFTRMGSPWVHPNLLGGFIALILPVTFLLAITTHGTKMRLALIVIIILEATGVLLSISRGAIASLAIIALWFAGKKVPYAGKVIAASLFAGALLTISYAPLQERLATMFSGSNASTQARLDEYKAFPKAVEKYPLGIGFKVEPPPPGDPELLGVSNLWLYYAYKLNLFGMLLFAWVSWRWWNEVNIKSPSSGPGAASLRMGLTGAILAALLTGLFDHYFGFTPVLVALFWMTLGLSLKAARWDNLKQTVPEAAGK